MSEGSQHATLADRTIITAGNQTERLFFGTEQSTLCADFLSMENKTGRLVITEAKSTNTQHAILQVRMTTWAAVHDYGAAAIGRVEIALKRGTPLEGDLMVVNGVLTYASTGEQIMAEHLPIRVVWFD